MADSDEVEDRDDDHATDTDTELVPVDTDTELVPIDTDTELVPSTESPDGGREHIEMLREAIDRNRGHDWKYYRERYRFTVVDDGKIRVSKQNTVAESQRAVETVVDHVVTVEAGVAVGCNCFMAGRRFGWDRCRHMRAVDAHPHL